MPGFVDILADIIEALKPPFRLKQLIEPRQIEWSVHSGPAIYALIDSGELLCFPPAILYVGQTDNLERRVRVHEQREEIIFDSVRSVFVEDGQMRKAFEREVIAFFRNRENGHAHTLLNERGRSRLRFPPR